MTHSVALAAIVSMSLAGAVVISIATVIRFTANPPITDT
jgi:hypothetical protein